jgi:hypothetical protein
MTPMRRLETHQPQRTPGAPRETYAFARKETVVQWSLGPGGSRPSARLKLGLVASVLPMPYTKCCVRTKIMPSEMAGVAMQASSILFTANT